MDGSRGLATGEYGECCCWGRGSLMNDLALSSRQKVKLETVRYSSNSNSQPAAVQAGTLRPYIELEKRVPPTSAHNS